MKRVKFFSILLTVVMLFSVGSFPVKAANNIVDIVLSDNGITVDGEAVSTDSSEAVYIGAEIVYYHDGTDSSYGEGTESDMHSAEEAAAHTVVTITQPGSYMLSGSLSKGQISIDLGENAPKDPKAVVTIYLNSVDVTCTVAPALIFYNVYECGAEDNSSAIVDTTAAGANVVILENSENNFVGSHVARIYKEGTTSKLHKYDAAFYSKRTMNIDGADSGVLNITGDNEGLDSELHMTINGGTININSQDDGINTNEDNVSVTTINGGNLTVNAGHGSEGDGIDSNGWLVINGGNVFTMSNESSPDGGIDADGEILINGGTLYAFGTRNDAASNNSAQPFMELSFASTLTAGSEVTVADSAGNVIWSAETLRRCQYITLTSESLELNKAYNVYVNGVQQCYTGNSSSGGGGRPGWGSSSGGSGSGSTTFTLTSSTKTFSGVCDSASSGKRFVTFTVDGVAESDGVNYIEEIVSIEPSLEVDSSLIQVTITDDPSEDYSAYCLLSDGLEAVNQLLPSEPGDYILTVAIISGNESYTGATQIAFSVADEEEVGIKNPFTDVPENEYYYEPVLWAVDQGITSGLTATTFGPEQSCTRGQVVTFLWRAHDCPEPKSTAHNFTDLKANEYYYKAVLWAVENGITSGMTKTTFAPDETVTRGQFVTFLHRAEGKPTYTVSNPFTDLKTGEYYYDAVLWAVENKVTSGLKPTLFGPEEPCTRGQVVTFLYRAYNK